MVLGISIKLDIFKRFLTYNFRKLAKRRRPDKIDGIKEAFHILENAYRKIISIEGSDNKEDEVCTYCNKLKGKWRGNCPHRQLSPWAIVPLDICPPAH